MAQPVNRHYPGTPGAPLYVGIAPPSGAITTLQLTSTDAALQSNAMVTFGQVFKAGDFLPTGNTLQARVAGTAIPTQTDAISLHRDGSVRYATVTVALASLAATETREVGLHVVAGTQTPWAVPAAPAWNLNLLLRQYSTADDTLIGTLTADPQAALQAAIAANEATHSGPNMAEYTIEAPVMSGGTPHPHLTARFHVRLYADGTICTDVVMENCRLLVANNENIRYELDIRQNATVLHAQARFTHFSKARWRKRVWTGGETRVRVAHDMAYLRNSRAFPYYDPDLWAPDPTAKEALLASIQTSLTAHAANSPMAAFLVQKSFPDTGGRPELGMLHAIAATYLITGDDRAKRGALAIGEGVSAAPVHYRDESTGQAVDVVTRPTLSLRFGVSSPAVPALPAGAGWSIDAAHQGSYAYVPYTLTGDTFFLEEMLFWASYNIAWVNPDYRGNAMGYVVSNEVRGIAWSMRSIWEVQAVMPQSHPKKAYYKKKLEDNLDLFATGYTVGTESFTPHPLKLYWNGSTGQFGDGHSVAPWQNDFLAMVWGLMAENNEPGAATYLNHLHQFTVGRINQGSVFPAQAAAAYYWYIFNPKGSAPNDFAHYIASWSDMLAVNAPSLVGVDPATIPWVDTQGPDGYPSILIAMLAQAINNGHATAATRYDEYASHFPDAMAKRRQLFGVGWAIGRRP